MFHNMVQWSLKAQIVSSHSSSREQTTEESIKQQRQNVEQTETGGENSLSEQLPILHLLMVIRSNDYLIYVRQLKRRHKSALALTEGCTEGRETRVGGYGLMWGCKEAWIFNLHLFWRLTGTSKMDSWGSKTNFLMRVGEEWGKQQYLRELHKQRCRLTIHIHLNLHASSSLKQPTERSQILKLSRATGNNWGMIN